MSRLAITVAKNRVSYGLGIKHYCFSDSPHAITVSKLSIDRRAASMDNHTLPGIGLVYRGRTL
jgi:hypothetical protein